MVTFPLRNIYNVDLKDLRRPDRLVLPLIRTRGLKIETMCDIAHALAHHLAVVVPSAT